ncbi:hypothetical protein RFI_21873 [Reticulomyxa filosa]|uniref:Bifunctional polynucleotide phosphatase/kinase n=1 Tax=Reticulomyxa filosa TaxID=46433 RepID=X6MNS2_RETFI|nr:hypothetical protein RFI_21873 [Reticulomyxa filosa]|eukprot:ETO15489.1 hypothetical protein RFI_21873 [Reticulomyxa filosa]
MSKKGGKRNAKAMKDDVGGSEEVSKKRARVDSSIKADDKSNKFGIEITTHETIVVMTPKNNEEHKRSKIAAFDMDSTLVEPKSGKKFPLNRQDWKWFFDGDVIPKKLKELYADGFRIVIISNQNGISKGHQEESDITGKIIDLSDEVKEVCLGIPLAAVFSKDEDHWRKPSKKMWQYFVKHCNNMASSDSKENEDKKTEESKGDGIDYTCSVYVGDAAGRFDKWDGKATTKKDFSCSDRKFAKNCGLIFHTPETFFLNQKETDRWEWGCLDPMDFLLSVEKLHGPVVVINDESKKEEKSETNEQIAKWFHGSLPIARSGSLDVVIMHGPPAAGKSTFVKRYLISQGYEWINRDTLNTQAKCLKAAEAALKAGKNVVIDNTNPDPTSRKPYAALAKKYKAKLRGFMLTTNRELADHLNLYREKLTEGAVARIGRMGVNSYYKKAREGGAPTTAEGFDEIATVDFFPKFENESQKQLFLEFN